jgi:hypothetical protein
MTTCSFYSGFDERIVDSFVPQKQIAEMEQVFMTQGYFLCKEWDIFAVDFSL